MTWIAALIPAWLALQDPDADRDGLPDFQEQHKYNTDPRKADSDGDGVPDGDWDERREHAYTVRTIVQVLPPMTRDVLQDDQQDARILEERPDYVELEVVHYPLNTVASAIVADPKWRAHIAARKELAPYLAPGITANWNPKMRQELVAALGKDGIDAAALDDKSLVEQASKWLFDHTEFADGFTTYCSTFDRSGDRQDGNAAARVLPGLEATAERGKNDAGLSVEEQWQRELFAAGMWRHRIHGTCTSSAIFLNGCLRALGLPTRIVLCIPLVDSSDERELASLQSKLTHHEVKRIVRGAIEPLGESWASHTFNEVWVGGRWRRLNYAKLGQGILDSRCFGLMTHVATFNDWSDGEMARTWGLRNASERKREDVFGGSNPYSCIALSDRFGAHAKVDNPPPPDPNDSLGRAPAGAELAFTLDRLVWSDDPALPKFVRDAFPDRPRLLARVAEWKEWSKVKELTIDGDPRFFLEAQGRPTLGVGISNGGFTWPEGDRTVAWVVFPLGGADWRDLANGVEYQLRPQNSKKGYRWTVKEGVVTPARS